MAPLAAILYLALAFDYGYACELTICWPKNFHVVGHYMDLNNDISKPFEIWYHSKKRRSRVDVHNGTVKRYYHQIKEEEPQVTLYTVSPESNRTGDSKMVCHSEPFEEKFKESFSRYLPSIDNFSYVGDETHRGKPAEVWEQKRTYPEEDDLEKIIMLRTYERIILQRYRKRENVVFPIRYIKTMYFLEKVAVKLKGHIIIDYDSTTPPTRKVLIKDLIADKELCPIVRHNLDSVLESEHVDNAFHRYYEHHNKSYETNQYELRKKIFRENWKLIKEHNNKNLTYKLAINEFADWTPSELEYLRGTRDEDVPVEGILPFPHTEAEVEDMVKYLPENYNMIIKGYISNVKGQGKCGSCWAFAATATIEGALARTHGGQLLELSPQSMIDCAWQYSSEGCNGSSIRAAFNYIEDFGIPTTMEYGPYLEEDGICKIKNMTNVFKIKHFVRVDPLNANALKVAIYKYGPVTAGIYFSPEMVFYSNGVFYGKKCTGKEKINHAVTLVGYGVQDGQPYWIVKNSYGESWGQNGYMLLSAKDNNCNLLMYAYYVVV